MRAHQRRLRRGDLQHRGVAFDAPRWVEVVGGLEADLPALAERLQALLVDALLGSGASGPLREPISTAVDLVNAISTHARAAGRGCSVLAIDAPTRIDLTGGGRQQSARFEKSIVEAFVVYVAKATNLCEPVFNRRPLAEHGECRAAQGETDVRACRIVTAQRDVACAVWCSRACS
jgi:hypothetical protein